MYTKVLLISLALASFVSNIHCDGVGHTHVHTEATDSTSTGTDAAAGDGDALSGFLKTIEENPSLAAAAAQAGYTIPPSGGAAYNPPPVGGAYNLPPPPPATGIPGGIPPGIPPGFGGAFGPLGGLGFGKNFNLNVGGSAGVGPVGLGLGGVGIAVIIEKVIVIIGGGLLILIILALLHGSILPGGFLNSLGAGFSNALAGSVNLDLGPIHKSASGAAAVNVNANEGVRVGGARPNDPAFNARVQDSVNRRF